MIGEKVEYDHEVEGFFLSNDNVNAMTKEFTLDGEELGEDLTRKLSFPSLEIWPGGKTKAGWDLFLMLLETKKLKR